ncbi:hypothetical protein [Desulfosarcina ovata]|uniref:Uncharacterized protein n=1 Tax=Desulfosarcina ovata subsp. ovata TaxID=2752305 RepID=A0A5K8AK14_9BACT|nr:hypothetical protein [Desulfosarcina ovata]BBO93021.1 hypothetical protein DSCOOX_62010 [Desulfosarcina ovata subsp. ovata]
MPNKTLSLQWKGTFIELCLGRVNRQQREALESRGLDLDRDIGSTWYDNTDLLESVFNAENWWSIDDLDHAMGLVFQDRATLDRQLSQITYTIDAQSVSVDPDALQISVYAPETLDPLDAHERIVCHGTRRRAVLHLEVEFSPPFDPSLITLSLLRYPDIGYILIDIDYDGDDEARFTWGETEYIQPRFYRRDHFDDTSG